MLAAQHRLNDAEDFRTVSRRGRRAGSRTVVVHLLAPEGEQAVGVPARAGFVVSKAVGVAVVRNRVKRRLRHLVRERQHLLPAGCRVVVRAQPAAAQAGSEELAADLDRCLSRAVAPGEPACAAAQEAR
ncbi:ribonuclease P protein component [Nocardioides sp.]|uniref:ribonuclease P protein component n=1 Tax=Nocardioides sp. TaxID=35761 RepID=UPI0035111C0F